MSVAVGTPVFRHLSHRSVRVEQRHTVPTSGTLRETDSSRDCLILVENQKGTCSILRSVASGRGHFSEQGHGMNAFRVSWRRAGNVQTECVCTDCACGPPGNRSFGKARRNPAVGRCPTAERLQWIQCLWTWYESGSCYLSGRCGSS